ncbi:alanine--glyoxylate aminotransferase 2, mitochondrial-like [Erinaceus europaeus]|uniref:Alanine--glyoxylate aminotransferase 2, mitochondrial-like n=1 Tax=Erinaceus europaeus TaxID=9365 RepID=A0ABM3XEE3_ERIEU|nr:alanine--glyoxylate aminotransferase 2, mitochondrial-like [Erinaceus europaeus]
MILAWRYLWRALNLEKPSPRILKTCLSWNSASWTTVTKLSLHTKPKMPPCDFTPERYQSLAYNHVLEINKQHLSPTLLAYFTKPLLLHQGHMEWLFDYEGNRYLDFFSGIVTVSVGHCHP